VPSVYRRGDGYRLQRPFQVAWALPGRRGEEPSSPGCDTHTASGQARQGETSPQAGSISSTVTLTPYPLGARFHTQHPSPTRGLTWESAFWNKMESMARSANSKDEVQATLSPGLSLPALMILYLGAALMGPVPRSM
jgi:hypothetical protein